MENTSASKRSVTNGKRFYDLIKEDNEKPESRTDDEIISSIRDKLKGVQ